ncbi:MAG: hypothetical protein IJW33_03860 [Lentisphaeria bacterium]|nr:hypothetical protein [Lentisphaeria bacterium]
MKKLIKPLMLIIPLIAGIFVPQARVLAAEPVNFIRWALFVMIFLNLLQVRFADLKPCREHLYVFTVNILMGVVPFLLLKWLFPATPVVAEAAFFTGIAPTAAAAAVIISLLDGKVGFAVTGFVITNLGISAVLIVLLPLIMGNVNSAFFLDVLCSMLTVIALPLILAQMTRKIFPAILNYIGILKNISLLLWSMSLFIMAAIARNYFDENADGSIWMILSMLVISLCICVANFTVGKFLSRRYRHESSQILGQKNTTFVIFLALEYSSGITALATIFYVIFHNVWNSIQLFIHQRVRMNLK